MSDTNQTKLPFSAAKLLIKICRAEAKVMGTEYAHDYEDWVLVCQPSDSRNLLENLGLIMRDNWQSENHFMSTGKGFDLYFKD